MGEINNEVIMFDDLATENVQLVDQMALPVFGKHARLLADNSAVPRMLVDRSKVDFVDGGAL